VKGVLPAISYLLSTLSKNLPLGKFLERVMGIAIPLARPLDIRSLHGRRVRLPRAFGPLFCHSWQRRPRVRFQERIINLEPLAETG